ncbi:hypothetical protein V4F39_03105 [Aquincola sp. MAHUQ-54]|uniref:Uncharacterized protein n=1 Tax=Aquincola agrisoli TaxID=3119538 RepID=A0AAW9QB07_9BURK
MTQHAEIVGEVFYREGDGPQMVIRPGPVEIELTERDATLSWEDGEARGLAAMPLADYKRYVAEGAIRTIVQAEPAGS